MPAPMHPLFPGHWGATLGSPSKQPVPAASTSRQKPQYTLCMAVQAPVPLPVQQPNGTPLPVHWLFGPASV